MCECIKSENVCSYSMLVLIMVYLYLSDNDFTMFNYTIQHHNHIYNELMYVFIFTPI